MPATHTCFFSVMIACCAVKVDFALSLYQGRINWEEELFKWWVKQRNTATTCSQRGILSSSIWKWTKGWTGWKTWSFFFHERRTDRSRYPTGDRCQATPWRQQTRTGRVRGTQIRHVTTAPESDTSPLLASDQQLLLPHFPVLLPIVGPLPQSIRAVCSSACPPTPRWFSAPGL